MPTKRVYGPSTPTKLALRGFRFIDGPDGALPAVPVIAAPVAPVVPPAEDKTDWKAEARKWEGFAKENKTAAEELAAIKDSQRTEAERQSDALAAAQKLATESAADALRARVALEKGLTAAQERRLIGTTKEELLLDADLLLTDIGKPAPTAPRPDPSAGPRNDAVSGSVQAGRDLFNTSRTKTS